MNKKQAIQAMLEGKKVTKKEWGNKNFYLRINEEGNFITPSGIQDNFNWYTSEGWEIHVELPKPKFKVGDWAKHKSGRYVKVLGIDNNFEELLKAVANITEILYLVCDGNDEILSFECDLQAVTD